MPLPSEAPQPCEICGDLTEMFCCGDHGVYEHMICNNCYLKWNEPDPTRCNIDWDEAPWFSPSEAIANLRAMEQELR